MIKQNKTDYLDEVGAVHLSYQYLMDGVSDFVWCHSSNKNNSFQIGFAHSNSGELLRTKNGGCLLYTSPSPRDLSTSRMPSSA